MHKIIVFFLCGITYVVLFIGAAVFPFSAVAQNNLLSPVHEEFGVSAGARYGAALACNGPQIAVGSPGVSVVATTDVGEVKLFDAVSRMSTATVSMPGSVFVGNERFGAAVTFVSDVSGDSVPDIFIGAPGGAQGAVYLANSVTGSILATHPAPALALNFGWAVEELGVVTYGGIPRRTLMVGAPDTLGLDGAVYFYYFISPSFVLLRQLDGPATTKEGLGYCILGFPDLNADGEPEVLAGAPRRKNGGGTSVGGVTIYSPSNDLVIGKIDGLAPGLRFGESLTDVGDVNLDGVHDLLVGVVDPSTLGPGHAMLYSGASLTSANPQLLCDIVGSSGASQFGAIGASLGDLTGDGIPEFAIGDPTWRATDSVTGAGIVDAGAVHIHSYDSVNAACPRLQVLQGAVTPPNSMRFGNGLAAKSCNFNSDGISDLVAGSLRNGSGALSGSIVLLQGNPLPTPTPSATPLPPSQLDLSFSISELGTLRGRVEPDVAAQAGCEISLDAKIVAGNVAVPPRVIRRETAQGSRERFLFSAPNMPRICSVEGAVPALYLRARLSCAGNEIRSNIAGRYLNCGVDSSGLSLEQWLDLFSQVISEEPSVQHIAKHRRRRARALIRRRAPQVRCSGSIAFKNERQAVPG